MSCTIEAGVGEIIEQLGARPGEWVQADGGCTSCGGAPMDVRDVIDVSWGDGVASVRMVGDGEREQAGRRVRLRVIVAGDDVNAARARQTAAAMCLACVYSSRRAGDVYVCRKAQLQACSTLVGCPAGKWMAGVWRRTRWAWMVWVGVPRVLAAWLAMRGLRPRGGAYSGCGCIAKLKVMALRARRRLLRRPPTPATG